MQRHWPAQGAFQRSLEADAPWHGAQRRGGQPHQQSDP